MISQHASALSSCNDFRIPVIIQISKYGRRIHITSCWLRPAGKSIPIAVNTIHVPIRRSKENAYFITGIHKAWGGVYIISGLNLKADTSITVYSIKTIIPGTSKNYLLTIQVQNCWCCAEITSSRNRKPICYCQIIINKPEVFAISPENNIHFPIPVEICKSYSPLDLFTNFIRKTWNIGTIRIDCKELVRR